MQRNWTAARKMIGATLLGIGLLWMFTVPVRRSVVWASGAAQTAPSQVVPASNALRFQNVKLDTRVLQGSLSEEVHRWAAGASKPRWLGYGVAQSHGEQEICCSNFTGHSDGACGLCGLERNGSGVNITNSAGGNGKVNLEGPKEMAVMFRAAGDKIGKIRIFSMDCAADAGGLDVLWLDGVKAAESVELLEQFVLRDKTERDHDDSPSNSALAAIALHADPSADRALESFVSPERPEWLRHETAFWLGDARGAEGLRVLRKMAQSDPNSDVREQVTFALSVSSEAGALTEMIRMAHEDGSTEVRGQALFWLAQKAGNKAASAITGAIENDPDTEVKNKAVFALSQLPDDEGVPKLIEVAQTNRNPEVRKQAMFWLGQSEDPRALAFFEKVLSQ
jgi:HEAT repeats